MPDLLPVPPPLGWRPRLESVLRHRPLRASHVALVVVAAAVLLAGAIAVALWVLGTPPPSESLIPQVSAPSAAESPSTSSQVGSLMVQAAGAVLSPGVYRLPADARVIDVIDAAGGLAPGADADRLALAAKLSDGERVYVPRVGEALPSAPTGGVAEPSGPVDLNTASESDLDALPGVGPATAKAIVTYRESHGPFTSVDQLLEVRGIGPAKLEQLADLVRV